MPGCKLRGNTRASSNPSGHPKGLKVANLEAPNLEAANFEAAKLEAAKLVVINSEAVKCKISGHKFKGCCKFRGR